MLGAQAERDSGVEEVALVRGEAKRWEARVNELLLKYSSVDLAEYTRVIEKLKVPPLPRLSTHRSGVGALPSRCHRMHVDLALSTAYLAGGQNFLQQCLVSAVQDAVTAGSCKDCARRRL